METQQKSISKKTCCIKKICTTYLFFYHGKLATHRHNCNKINSEHTSMTESSIQCTAQKPLYNPRLQRPKLQPTENSWFGELTETPQFRSSMQHWPTQATHFQHTAASTEYRPVRRQQRSTPWCIITNLLERKKNFSRFWKICKCNVLQISFSCSSTLLVVQPIMHGLLRSSSHRISQ